MCVVGYRKPTMKDRWLSFKYKVHRDMSDLCKRTSIAIKKKDIHYLLYDGALLHAYTEIQRYKKERCVQDPIEVKYGNACLREAFKCYKIFCKARHSGLSASITFDIFKDLVDWKPLTPITKDDAFGYSYESENHIKSYQCARYGALFRDEDGDKITYHDNNRVLCIEKKTGYTFYSGAIARYIDKEFPITLPYMPLRAEFKVYIDYYIVREPEDEYQDYEAMHLLYYIKKGDDVKRDIDLYVVYDEDIKKMVYLTPIEWEAKYAGQYRKA